MTKLHDLFEQQNQSPWLDNLRRDYCRGGHLQELVDQGVRGVTSNPTIFAKAIEAGSDYDEQFGDLLASHSVEEAYWTMVEDDIREALAILRPVHDASDGLDGYVSLEVAPALAHDEAATTAAARRFHEQIAAPNLYVKIPGTAEGVPAIRAMVAEGRNINVTLLFSLERYGDVIEAYIGGLEDHLASGATDLSHVHGVASFFVSRVDTEVDRRLETLAAGDAARSDALLRLRGTAAVAQAKLAYQLFVDRFHGPRWEALAAKGANVQRPLWASTSTKNPSYPDLLYVDTLVGPNTVNTMPDATIDAFLDHGGVARTVDTDVDGARRTLEALAECGVDMADVGHTLEDEGVASFAKSFDELMQALSDKANALAGGR
ncbi:MAG TPA: transaldolase [Acidimicrobiales bacterium]|nr:transaldolase [Acidimicrobiales bacterium]